MNNGKLSHNANMKRLARMSKRWPAKRMGWATISSVLEHNTKAMIKPKDETMVLDQTKPALVSFSRVSLVKR